MTREEAKYILRNTAFLAPSLVPVDEAVDMACDALDKVTYINSQLDKADRKTEPTISKMEQVDEPKTQTKTQNSNLTFEKADERKCIDCNFLTYMFGKTWCNIKCENPHDKVCDRFKPKDEPQTDCSWK